MEPGEYAMAAELIKGLYMLGTSYMQQRGATDTQINEMWAKISDEMLKNDPANLPN